MKTGDKVWSSGGVEGEVVDTAALAELGVVRVRWPWGDATQRAHEVFTNSPHEPATEVTALREENAALRASMAKAKANVRDACATACAEVAAEYEKASGDDMPSREELVARRIADAIAALDLEAL